MKMRADGVLRTDDGKKVIFPKATKSALSPREAMKAWAKRWCTAAALAKLTGYSYMHAWQLVSGTVDVTPETVGRLVLVFGEKAVQEVVDAVRVAEGLTQWTPDPQQEAGRKAQG